MLVRIITLRIDNTGEKIRNHVDKHEREANRMISKPKIQQAHGKQDGTENRQQTEQLHRKTPLERRSTTKISNKSENDQRKTSHRKEPEITYVIWHNQPQRKPEQHNRKRIGKHRAGIISFKGDLSVMRTALWSPQGHMLWA